MVGWQTLDTGESWLDGLNWTSVEVGQHAMHKVLSPSIILICQIQEKCFVYTYYWPHPTMTQSVTHNFQACESHCRVGSLFKPDSRLM